MKKILLFIYFILSFQNISIASDFDIVAKVNDKIITKYDLKNYSKLLNLYFEDSKEIKKNIKKEALNSLIEETIKEEAIKKEKIPFDEEEFKYFLKVNSDKVDFQKKYKKYKFDLKMYHKIMKNAFLWNKLIEIKIKPKIFVNDSEVRDSLEYLATNPIRIRYNISQILIYEKNKESNVKVIAEKIYEEIKNKNNFKSMAKKFSKNENDDYIGWVDEHDINEKIRDAIRNLQIGSISKPLYFADRNQVYYLIIKLNDKKEEYIARKNDVLRVKYFIFNQKLNLSINKYFNNLYNNAFIEKYNDPN